MKLSGREPAYEAARTWTLHPVSHPPPGWAQIVRHGVASWVHAMLPACTAPLSESQAPAIGYSPLLTLVAAMIAEVCQ